MMALDGHDSQVDSVKSQTSRSLYKVSDDLRHHANLHGGLRPKKVLYKIKKGKAWVPLFWFMAMCVGVDRIVMAELSTMEIDASRDEILTTEALEFAEGVPLQRSPDAQPSGLLQQDGASAGHNEEMVEADKILDTLEAEVLELAEKEIEMGAGEVEEAEVVSHPVVMLLEDVDEKASFIEAGSDLDSIEAKLETESMAQASTPTPKKKGFFSRGSAAIKKRLPGVQMIRDFFKAVKSMGSKSPGEIVKKTVSQENLSQIQEGLKSVSEDMGLQPNSAMSKLEDPATSVDGFVKAASGKGKAPSSSYFKLLRKVPNLVPAVLRFITRRPKNSFLEQQQSMGVAVKIVPLIFIGVVLLIVMLIYAVDSLVDYLYDDSPFSSRN